MTESHILTGQPSGLLRTSNPAQMQEETQRAMGNIRDLALLHAIPQTTIEAAQAAALGTIAASHALEASSPRGRS